MHVIILLETEQTFYDDDSSNYTAFRGRRFLSYPSFQYILYLWFPRLNRKLEGVFLFFFKFFLVVLNLVLIFFGRVKFIPFHFVFLNKEKRG